MLKDVSKIYQMLKDGYEKLYNQTRIQPFG